MQQLGVAEFAGTGLKLKMAALLLFANDVQKWHPRCQMRILKVEGDELGSGDDYNVISDEIVQGVSGPVKMYENGHVENAP